ncbi:MAG: type IV pilin protein [Candidatus Wenzhouxiangella sp. M2_3B_020]
MIDTKHHRRPPVARSAGFTLIELMIAVAVLAIIVGIAIPSFSRYVIESGRADAHSVLYQAAQQLERCYTRFSAYNDGNCGLQQGNTMMSENDKYQLQVSAVGANTFELTAAPRGSQTKDTECGSFTLDHTGAKGVSTSEDADVIAECW